MSIISFIEKVCVQTAVYWGAPVDDGFGGKTYEAPREVKCRWDDKTRLIYDRMGKEVLSKAEVLLVEQLVEEGWLYLGYLSDLEDPDNDYAVPSNPKEVIGSYEIIGIDRTPLFRSTTEFVNVVYLGFFNVK